MKNNSNTPPTYPRSKPPQHLSTTKETNNFFLKMGIKQRHVTIPEGWSKVTSGVCTVGDMFCRTDTHKFMAVEADDVNMPWDSFDLLIRKM